MKPKMILLIIIAAYLLLLFDFKATYANKNYNWKIQYNGLLWVGLDYWSIAKYHSNDIPMKWVDCKRSGIITKESWDCD